MDSIINDINQGFDPLAFEKLDLDNQERAALLTAPQHVPAYQRPSFPTNSAFIIPKSYSADDLLRKNINVNKSIEESGDPNAFQKLFKIAADKALTSTGSRNNYQDTLYDYNPQLSKFDRGYDPTKTFEENDAAYADKEYEWGWKSLLTPFKFLGKTLYSAGVGLAQSGAMGVALLDSDRIGEKDMWASLAENQLLRNIEEKDEEFRNEFMPVYKTLNYDNKGFFAKFKDPTFWRSEAPDTIGNFLSFLVPGAFASKAIGAVGGAAALAEATGTAGKALQFFTGAKNAAGVGSWALNTFLESAHEALDTNKRIIESLNEQINPVTGVEYTYDEKRARAAEASSEVFKGNLGVLMFSNALENKWLRRVMNPRSANSMFPNLSEIELDASLKALRKLPQNKLTKFMADNAIGKRLTYYVPRAARSTALEGYWEENSQSALQRLAEIKYGVGSYTRFGDEGEKQETSTIVNDSPIFTFINQLFKQTRQATAGNDSEVATAIGLGGMIGIVGEVGTSKLAPTRDSIEVTDEQGNTTTKDRTRWFVSERQQEEEATLRTIDELNRVRESFLNFSNILDPDGTINQAKLDTLKQKYADIANIANLSTDVINPIVKSQIEKNLFSEFVLAHISAGTINSLLDKMAQPGSPDTLLNLQGFSNEFRQDPSTFYNLAQNLRRAHEAIQDIRYKGLNENEDSLLRSSLYNLNSRKLINDDAVRQLESDAVDKYQDYLGIQDQIEYNEAMLQTTEGKGQMATLERQQREDEARKLQQEKVKILDRIKAQNNLASAKEIEKQIEEAYQEIAQARVHSLILQGYIKALSDPIQGARIFKEQLRQSLNRQQDPKTQIAEDLENGKEATVPQTVVDDIAQKQADGTPLTPEEQIIADQAAPEVKKEIKENAEIKKTPLPELKAQEEALNKEVVKNLPTVQDMAPQVPIITDAERQGYYDNLTPDLQQQVDSQLITLEQAIEKQIQDAFAAAVGDTESETPQQDLPPTPTKQQKIQQEIIKKEKQQASPPNEPPPQSPTDENVPQHEIIPSASPIESLLKTINNFVETKDKVIDIVDIDSRGFRLANFLTSTTPQAIKDAGYIVTIERDNDNFMNLPVNEQGQYEAPKGSGKWKDPGLIMVFRKNKKRDGAIATHKVGRIDEKLIFNLDYALEEGDRSTMYSSARKVAEFRKALTTKMGSKEAEKVIQAEKTKLAKIREAIKEDPTARIEVNIETIQDNIYGFIGEENAQTRFGIIKSISIDPISGLARATMEDSSFDGRPIVYGPLLHENPYYSDIRQVFQATYPSKDEARRAINYLENHIYTTRSKENGTFFDSEETKDKKYNISFTYEGKPNNSIFVDGNVRTNISVRMLNSDTVNPLNKRTITPDNYLQAMKTVVKNNIKVKIDKEGNEYEGSLSPYMTYSTSRILKYKDDAVQVADKIQGTIVQITPVQTDQRTLIEERRQEELRNIPMIPQAYDNMGNKEPIMIQREAEAAALRKQINAKYDAEIAALNQLAPTIEITPTATSPLVQTGDRKLISQDLLPIVRERLAKLGIKDARILIGDENTIDTTYADRFWKTIQLVDLQNLKSKYEENPEQNASKLNTLNQQITVFVNAPKATSTNDMPGDVPVDRSSVQLNTEEKPAPKKQTAPKSTPPPPVIEKAPVEDDLLAEFADEVDIYSIDYPNLQVNGKLLDPISGKLRDDLGVETTPTYEELVALYSTNSGEMIRGVRNVSGRDVEVFVLPTQNNNILGFINQKREILTQKELDQLRKECIN